MLMLEQIDSWEVLSIGKVKKKLQYASISKY